MLDALDEDVAATEGLNTDLVRKASIKDLFTVVFVKDGITDEENDDLLDDGEEYCFHDETEVSSGDVFLENLPSEGLCNASGDEVLEL